MIRKRVKIMTGLIALLFVAGFYFGQQEMQLQKMLADQQLWEQTREADLLKAESSWINLAGLFWLEQGASWTMGAAADNDFVMKEGNAPAFAGTLLREADTVSFEIAADALILVDSMTTDERVIQLKDDEGGYGDPTVLSAGPLQWWLISRDGMLGIRVRNMESAHLAAFEGIDRFGFDADWKVTAQFLPFEEPRVFEYPTILGTMREEAAPGVLVFELDGQQYEMVPFERRDGTKLFLVFGDESNSNATYEGGRFMYVDLPDETGKTTIDFNRAYNPPCAFSPYSTCPKPLRQNRLPVFVDAGEKRYVKPI